MAFDSFEVVGEEVAVGLKISGPGAALGGVGLNADPEIGVEGAWQVGEELVDLGGGSGCAAGDGVDLGGKTGSAGVVDIREGVWVKRGVR